ncbi:MAG TPA: FAD-dependent monooxygenase [Streptosporangiaceae bacterium]|jgi:2-polyprenyl-6-methoxyphenol hydroxylase-like FAD-dependent oxidoreductase
MTDRQKALVAGGGIAGLAAAAALAQAGWQVTVLERAPAFGEVGAGLGFTSNGMAALGALGVAEEIRAAGHLAPHAGYQDPSGRWLLRIPGTRSDPQAATTICGIHRQRLHATLRQRAETAGAELVTGAEVTAVRPGDPGGEPAALTWRTSTGEHTCEADLVLAADGVRSAVRAQLFPDARPQYAGSTSWRAVISDTAFEGRLVEVWGPGTEFGALRVSDSEVYWYGEFVHPEGASFPDELAAARAHFAGWAPWIRAMVAATPASTLMRHDVYHLPGGCPRYVHGRVALAGDAAHAMLPTIGQGAATALEDGVCVGRMIAAPARAGGDLAAAMAAFDQARRSRCRQLARQASQLARFGFELGDGWRQSARNTLLRLIPAGPALKAGARMTRWTPPDSERDPAAAGQGARGR